MPLHLRPDVHLPEVPLVRTTPPVHRPEPRGQETGRCSEPVPLADVEAHWRELDRTSWSLVRTQGVRRPLRPHLAPHAGGAWGRASAQNLLRAHVEGLGTDVQVVPDHEGSVPRSSDGSPSAGGLGGAVLSSYDAVAGSPHRVVAHVVSDVPAWACPSAAGWLGGTPLDPVEDGAVLTVLDVPRRAAEPHDDEVAAVVRACGRAPHLVDLGVGPVPHAALRAALTGALDEVAQLQGRHRGTTGPVGGGVATVSGDVRWPVVVLRTPPRWGRGPERDRGGAR